MSSIAAALKSEIVRLARKELKREVVHLRKQAASHRTSLAALRKQVADLEKQVRRGGNVSPRPERHASATDALRFSAKGVKSLRANLGLSAAGFGRLLGVSGNTVFNWEGGKARPQRAQLESLHGLRKLGKRAAWARLEQME